MLVGRQAGDISGRSGQTRGRHLNPFVRTMQVPKRVASPLEDVGNSRNHGHCHSSPRKKLALRRWILHLLTMWCAGTSQNADSLPLALDVDAVCRNRTRRGFPGHTRQGRLRAFMGNEFRVCAFADGIWRIPCHWTRNRTNGHPLHDLTSAPRDAIDPQPSPEEGPGVRYKPQ